MDGAGAVVAGAGVSVDTPRITHLACTSCLKWVRAGEECPSCGADEVYRGQGETCLHPPAGYECWNCGCPIDAADTPRCPHCHLPLLASKEGEIAAGAWVSVEETMRGVRSPSDPDADYKARQRWLESHGQQRLEGME